VVGDNWRDGRKLRKRKRDYRMRLPANNARDNMLTQKFVFSTVRSIMSGFFIKWIDYNPRQDKIGSKIGTADSLNRSFLTYQVRIVEI